MNGRLPVMPGLMRTVSIPVRKVMNPSRTATDDDSRVVSIPVRKVMNGCLNRKKVKAMSEFPSLLGRS